MTPDRLQTAIGDIYDCADDGATWDVCLTSIRALLSGTSANLLYNDHRSKNAGITVAVGADPELYRLYSEYGHALDPWKVRIQHDTSAAGRVILGASLLQHAQMKSTDFYGVMGNRYETTRAIIGFLDFSPLRSALLSVNRGDSGQEFDERDARTLAILLPHVRRALAIRRRLGTLHNQYEMAAEAVDYANIGVILVDDHARPIFENAYAARLLAARDGLAIDRGSLRAATPTLTGQLRSSLASAIAVTKGEAVAVRDSEFALPRAGGRPLQAGVTPISARNRWVAGSRRAAAMLFLVDPDRMVLPDAAGLQQWLALTPAEARIAVAVASATSISDIADEFRISRETVRTHVKRILGKAGVRSQTEFVRLAAGAATGRTRSSFRGN